MTSLVAYCRVEPIEEFIFCDVSVDGRGRPLLHPNAVYQIVYDVARNLLSLAVT